MKQTFRRVANMIGLMALVAGCSPAPEADTGGKKKVLTSFTILADMARNVAGDAAIGESQPNPGANIPLHGPTHQKNARHQRAKMIHWKVL